MQVDARQAAVTPEGLGFPACIACGIHTESREHGRPPPHIEPPAEVSRKQAT